jgi:hypothetical protein
MVVYCTKASKWTSVHHALNKANHSAQHLNTPEAPYLQSANYLLLKKRCNLLSQRTWWLFSSSSSSEIELDHMDETQALHIWHDSNKHELVAIEKYPARSSLPDSRSSWTQHCKSRTLRQRPSSNFLL